MKRLHILSVLLILVLLNGCASGNNQNVTVNSSLDASTRQNQPIYNSSTLQDEISDSSTDKQQALQESTDASVSAPSQESIQPTATSSGAGKHTSPPTVKAANAASPKPVGQTKSPAASAKPNSDRNNFQNQDGQSRRQGGFERAEASGEVDTINGSKIAIKLIEMPQMGQRNGQRPQIDGKGTPPPHSQDRQGQEGQRMQRQITYTGEKQTITVNSSTKIYTMTRSQDGMETVDKTLADIKTGDMLSIWFADKASGTASKISIQQKRQ